MTEHLGAPASRAAGEPKGDACTRGAAVGREGWLTVAPLLPGAPHPTLGWAGSPPAPHPEFTRTSMDWGVATSIPAPSGIADMPGEK